MATANLGFAVDSSQAKKAAVDLDALTASAKGAQVGAEKLGAAAETAAKGEASLDASTRKLSASAEALAASEKLAMVAANGNTAAIKGHASAAGLGSTQTMALFHSIRSMTESMALGVSPVQALTMQMNHLSYVLSGPGGVRGAIAGIGQLAMKGVSLIAPLAPAIAAVGIEFLGLDNALEKATGKSVSFGQIFTGIITMIGEGIESRFKPAVSSINSLWKDAWSGVASFAVDQFNIMARNAVQFVDQIRFGVETIETYWDAAGQAAIAIWSSLPAALGNITISIANNVITGVQAMINGAAGLINKFITMANGLIGKVPLIGKNLQLGTVGTVDFGKVANPFGGAAGDLGKQLTDIAAGASAKVANDYKAMQQDMAKSAGTDYFKGLTAQIRKEQAAADAATAKKGHRAGGGAHADPYGKLITSAQDYIKTQQAERDSIGLTEQAADTLKHQQELLNKAQQEGIKLTPAQTQQLKDLGAQMGAAEAATKKLKEAYDFTKQTVGGFLSSFTSAIEQGKGLWQAFGDAAKSVLDKIINKINDQLATAITDALFKGNGASGGGGGGIFGGIFGGIGKLLGFAGGGYTGSASRSGGIDGQGGFMAILHPQETVIDHMRGGSQVSYSPANQNNASHTHVTVGVSVDNNGNLQAYVKDVAQTQAKQVSAAVVGQYDRNLNRSLGARMQQAQARQV